MAKRKLTWEWGEHPDEIIIRKDKGKLTMDEIWTFLQEPEQMNAFGEESLAVILFRIRQRDGGYFESEPDEGDAQNVYILQDGSSCICGRKEIALQYCPHCGEKLNRASEVRV